MQVSKYLFLANIHNPDNLYYKRQIALFIQANKSTLYRGQCFVQERDIFTFQGIVISYQNRAWRCSFLSVNQSEWSFQSEFSRYTILTRNMFCFRIERSSVIGSKWCLCKQSIRIPTLSSYLCREIVYRYMYDITIPWLVMMLRPYQIQAKYAPHLQLLSRGREVSIVPQLHGVLSFCGLNRRTDSI